MAVAVQSPLLLFMKHRNLRGQGKDLYCKGIKSICLLVASLSLTSIALQGCSGSLWRKGGDSAALTPSLNEARPALKPVALGEVVAFQLISENRVRNHVILVGKTGGVEKISLVDGTRTPLGQILGPVQAAAVASTPNNAEDFEKESLLVVASDRGASLYKFPSLEHIVEMPSSTARFTAISFDTARRSVLLGGSDGLVYRWKLFDASGEFKPSRKDGVERYFGHAHSLTTVLPAPQTPQIFFSVDEGGVLSAFRTYDSDRFGGKYDTSLFDDRAYADQAARRTYQLKSGSSITAMAASSDGQLIALGGQDGSLEILTSKGLTRRALVKIAHRGDVLSVVFLGTLPLSNNAREKTQHLLASIGRDGQVCLWKISSSIAEGQAMQKEYSVELLKTSPVPGGYRLLALGLKEVGVATRDSKVLAVKFSL